MYTYEESMKHAKCNSCQCKRELLLTFRYLEEYYLSKTSCIVCVCVGVCAAANQSKSNSLINETSSKQKLGEISV